MRVIPWTAEDAFPLVLGLIDGILTTLTLASGRVIRGTDDLTWGLALRIAGASSLASGFVFFAAEYTRVRGTLVREGRQLNLPVRGHLASTRMGRAGLQDAAGRAALSSGANLVGAFVPLLVAVLYPRYSWVSILIALGLLAGLGLLVARAVAGRWVRWSAGLALAGFALAMIGAEINIV
jgi:VIT1/CCC1 family predicted Fe2+/Mn2+ transporter